MANVNINGVIYDIPNGTGLKALLADKGIVSMPCAGKGICGKCRVVISGAIAPPDERELAALSEDELNSGVRLACRTGILGDCTVKTVINGCDTVCADGVMRDVEPDPVFSHFGAVVDIGTTTLAAKLYGTNGLELARCSCFNPQCGWGADVISRIEAAMSGDAVRMRTAVVGKIDDMLLKMAADAGINVSYIDGIVITGNTTMLHLLTCTSPEPLSHSPFKAERLFGEILSADELGLKCCAGGSAVYLPPCISAFVGGDTVCALLAGGLCEGNATGLMVDVGTNGEIAMWHGGRLFCCSTAAGPAFEGAGISMGMSGGNGAIDRVFAAGNKLHTHVIGDEKSVGICGSGIVDAVAAMLITEQLDPTGLLDEDPFYLTENVCITQQDIRMVQLAKSAVCAGIKTLVRHCGVSFGDISVLQIAGGFGKWLDIKNACVIGLLPNELKDKVQILGNAALSGAAMLLIDKKLQKTATDIASRACTVELAGSAVFADEYMNGMFF